MKWICAGSGRSSSGAELGRAELPQRAVGLTAGDGPESAGHGLSVACWSWVRCGSWSDPGGNEIAAIARRHKGRSVAVFGSVARGEERAGSDVDFLVEFEPGSSLFGLMDLEDELAKLLAVSVDVVSAGGLKKGDQHIRDEAISLA